MAFDPATLAQLSRPHGLPFRIAKLGHVVLNVSDLKRSVAFYTGLLGFAVSDVYPEAMMPGGMVFMRCNADHHGVALVGSLPGQSASRELNHLAFEVATLDEVVRARPSARPWREDRLRGPPPRRLPDRRRVPRPRQSPA